MTTQSIRNSISRSPLRLAFLLIPLSLAIFTARVDAEHATKQTLIQIPLQVPRCNVNAIVTLKGTINLSSAFFVLPNDPLRLHVHALVRDQKLQASTSADVYNVEGTTELNTDGSVINGLATFQFPGSFKVQRGNVRFLIVYTAHLRIRQDNRGFFLEGVNYDNFQVGCL